VAYGDETVSDGISLFPPIYDDVTADWLWLHRLRLSGVYFLQ